jgi:hypothetical protein
LSSTVAVAVTELAPLATPWAPDNTRLDLPLGPRSGAPTSNTSDWVGMIRSVPNNAWAAYAPPTAEVNDTVQVPSEPVVHVAPGDTFTAEGTLKLTTAPGTRLLLASRAVTVAVKAEVPSAGTELTGDTVQLEFAATATPGAAVAAC